MINGLINFVTAWVSVVLMVLVSIIWVLRLLVKYKIVKKDTFLFEANKKLRVHHKSLGISLVVSSLIHGIVSSQDVLSLNLGSITFFVIALMGVSYIIRSKVKRKIWLNVHRGLVIASVALLILHLTDVGIQGTALINSAPPEQIEYNLSQDEIDDVVDEIDDDNTMQAADNDGSGNTYNDGTYTGVADGFGSDLTLEVTIKDNIITDIVIVSHNERNSSYYGPPMESVPKQIIETQSLDVDIVSGATYTSVGIKNAVNDALSQAITSGELPEMDETTSGGHGHGKGR